jgi:hypothetical protein
VRKKERETERKRERESEKERKKERLRERERDGREREKRGLELRLAIRTKDEWVSCRPIGHLLLRRRRRHLRAKGLAYKSVLPLHGSDQCRSDRRTFSNFRFRCLAVIFALISTLFLRTLILKLLEFFDSKNGLFEILGTLLEMSLFEVD